MDGIDDIPAFVAVVEAGGFAAAARRLGRSRSALAKSVQRLEGRLDARLFHRTTRRLSLTEEGHAYYEHCERALGELRAGAAMLAAGQAAVRGTLRVTMPMLFGRICVAPILTRLATDHPELVLDLDFCDRPVDLVDQGFDLAVRNDRLGDGAGHTARRIGTKRTGLYASPSYVARCGAPAKLADLEHHAALAYSRDGRIQKWIFPIQGGDPVMVTPSARMRFGDLGTLADAAAAGHGLAWLPDWLTGARMQSGELIPVLDVIPPFVGHTFVVWPETKHLALRVRVAIDALAEGLG